jgi:hypothetical protein
VTEFYCITNLDSAWFIQRIFQDGYAFRLLDYGNQWHVSRNTLTELINDFNYPLNRVPDSAVLLKLGELP